MEQDLKKLVRTQFGKTASAYVHSTDFSGGEDLEAARELLQPVPEDLMLDVATGGGHTALFFAPLVKTVVASDLTIQMLKKAQEVIAEEKGVDNISFREADAEDLPFPAGSFTLLTCRIAPHHFYDLSRAIQEFFRVLRRGGRMVIIDTLRPDNEELAEFQARMEKLRDPSHNRTYGKKHWLEELESAGFRELRSFVFRKSRDFENWVKRAGMAPAAHQELIRMFLEAPPSVRDYFHMDIIDGEIRRFSDEKILLYAQKPSKK